MEFKSKLSRYWRLTWPYLIFVVAAIFILWAQKNSKAFFVGEDSWFHMNQFYESAMQIKTGHFSWFLTLFGFGQNGRIVNAIYGPVFSYLVGGLLLLAGSWYRLQLILSFAALVISGGLMYHLSKSVDLRRNISVILGLIYLSSYPVTTFVNEQTFSGLGDALLPLVILMGIRMWKSRKVNVISLAVLMAVLLQIHLLTAVVAALSLAPFGFLSFVKATNKPKWLVKFGETVILFMVLTANVWGTMWDTFRGNHIIKPFPNFGMGMARFSLGWFNGSLSLLDNCFILIGAMVIALLMMHWHRLTFDQKVIPLLSAGFLFLSSTYFPWTAIARRIPFISETFQFPKRLLGTAVILLLITLGKGITRLGINKSNNNGVAFIIMALLVIIAGYSITSEEGTIESHVAVWHSKQVFIVNDTTLHPKMSVQKLRNAFNSHNLSLAPKFTIKASPDYLPSDHPVTVGAYNHDDPYGKTLKGLLRYRPVYYQLNKKRKAGLSKWLSIKSIKSPLRFKRTVRNHSLIFTWRQPKRLAGRKLSVPAVKYRHTSITFNHRPQGHVKINRIGMVQVTPKAGVNQLTLRYHASLLWKVSIVIVIASWLLLVLYLVIMVIKNF